MARADHITVPRLGGVFVHHGIDCGDGTVIHFTGATWAEPRSVRRTSMQEFARGAAVAVRDYREFFERLEQPENLPRRVRIRWQRELARLAGDDRGRTEFAPGAVIRECYSAGTISGAWFAGGIAGLLCLLLSDVNLRVTSELHATSR